ncbi:AlbA family DNA-binding domain-containing protein [Marinigracilibium pacificum]|uniref:ATP-binding protein n=1 Tax=Marinigracilibium pacificum TaxID=2729599 RepID=A0A848J463_9BACT|nr:ATP-binding protein [Marinigracilibium pacificum]NMM50295.1 ATP-binding protein [Marinigracilibium pacificum]
MDIKTLKNLVRQGEGQHIEFKKKVNHPEKIIREIVAFANTSGGKLFIGVSDEKELSGLKYPEEDIYEMEGAIAKLIRPKLNYSLESVSTFDNKTILCYDIKESKRKPHYALEKPGQKFGRAYVRVEDRSIQASREVLEVIKLQNSQRDVWFEYGENERILMNYLADHEKVTLREYMREAGLPKVPASKILVTLVLAGVLEIYPSDKEDVYKLANQKLANEKALR